MAVVELHAPSKVDDIRQRIRRLQPLCEPWLGAEVVSVIHQRVVDQLTDARRALVVGLERVQAVGSDTGREGDDVWVGRLRLTGATRQKC
jgi:hypothetical protein